ncbi:hypothetical protein GCM10027072_54280 [Streptomyces bullii]
MYMTRQASRSNFLPDARRVRWDAQKGSSSSPDRRHTAQPAEPAPGAGARTDHAYGGLASETFGKQCTPVPHGTGARVRCRAEVSAYSKHTLGGAAPTD